MLQSFAALNISLAAAPGIFIRGGYNPWGWRTEVLWWSPGAKPR